MFDCFSSVGVPEKEAKICADVLIEVILFYIRQF